MDNIEELKEGGRVRRELMKTFIYIYIRQPTMLWMCLHVKLVRVMVNTSV